LLDSLLQEKTNIQTEIVPPWLCESSDLVEQLQISEKVGISL